MPVGKFGRLRRSFLIVCPISLPANAIEGSYCIINVVLPVFTTNSSAAARLTHNPEKHSPQKTVPASLIKKISTHPIIGKLLDSFTSLGAHSI
jgi:hypothetical protein